jgi:hypothetical protein
MFSQAALSRFAGMAGGRATHARGHYLLARQIPDPCPKCEGVIKQSLKTLNNGKQWCPVHGVIQEQRLTLIREMEQGLGL